MALATIAASNRDVQNTPSVGKLEQDGESVVDIVEIARDLIEQGR
jgi:hypothetical protein